MRKQQEQRFANDNTLYIYVVPTIATVWASER